MKGGAQDKIRKQTKKALIVTTVSGFVPQFEMNNVRILQELGYEVHYASNFRNPSYGNDNSRLAGTGILCHQIDLERSPFRIFAALRACRQLKALLKKEHFDLLHCHTPMGGAVARLAAARAGGGQKKKRFGTNSIYSHDKPFVIYTAHGFHFYRGAPLINWLLYYPAERWLARYTDVMITINGEDYRRAKRFRLRGGRKGTQVFRVNGVGIDVERFRGSQEVREAKRKELGVREDEFLLLSVGELSRGKNHQTVIRALAELLHERRLSGNRKLSKPGIKYAIAGEGRKRQNLEQMIRRKKLQENVMLLGYRTDIRELLMAADCFVFPSKREGMPVALMEAIASGVPCVAADIRGCRELLKKNELVKKNRVQEYCRILQRLYTAARKKKAEEKCYGSAEGDVNGSPERKQTEEKQVLKRLERISGKKIQERMRQIYLYASNCRGT